MMCIFFFKGKQNMFTVWCKIYTNALNYANIASSAANNYQLMDLNQRLIVVVVDCSTTIVIYIFSVG